MITIKFINGPHLGVVAQECPMMTHQRQPWDNRLSKYCLPDLTSIGNLENMESVPGAFSHAEHMFWGITQNIISQ